MSLGSTVSALHGEEVSNEQGGIIMIIISVTTLAVLFFPCPMEHWHLVHYFLLDHESM